MMKSSEARGAHPEFVAILVASPTSLTRMRVAALTVTESRTVPLAAVGGVVVVPARSTKQIDGGDAVVASAFDARTAVVPPRTSVASRPTPRMRRGAGERGKRVMGSNAKVRLPTRLLKPGYVTVQG